MRYSDRPSITKIYRLTVQRHFDIFTDPMFDASLGCGIVSKDETGLIHCPMVKPLHRAHLGNSCLCRHVGHALDYTTPHSARPRPNLSSSRMVCRADVLVAATVPPLGWRVAQHPAACCAAVDVESLVPSRERCLRPAHLGLPAICGLGGAVSDAGADQHRLRWELVPLHRPRSHMLSVLPSAPRLKPALHFVAKAAVRVPVLHSFASMPQGPCACAPLCGLAAARAPCAPLCHHKA